MTPAQIKKLRESLGYTMDEFAHALGYSWSRSRSLHHHLSQLDDCGRQQAFSMNDPIQPVAMACFGLGQFQTGPSGQKCI